MRLIIIVCFTGFGLICSGYKQSGTEFNHNFNLPKMMEQINSHVSTSQDLKNTSSGLKYILNLCKDLISNGVFEQFLKDLAAQTDENKCVQDIKYVFQNFQAKDMWGLKMLDAFGKPESGILEGNFKWLGNYHECLKVYAPPNENSTAGDFNGQYCTLGLSVKVFNITLPLSLGVCLPDSCGSVPAESIIDTFPSISEMSSYVNITKKTCQPTSKKLTSAAIAMICLLSFFVFLAVIGSSITAIEYFVQANVQEGTYWRNNEQIQSQIDNGDLEKQQSQGSSSTTAQILHGKEYKGWYGKIMDFFNCFCIFTNGEKLLNTDSTEGQLLCLHGIRFLSMAWVIVCHTYACLLTTVGNIVESISLIDSWLFQIILNGFFCVDSFFLLSGFLVSYLYFQVASKKNGEFPWLYFYIHRFIRLTPVYMVVLGFYAALNYYIGFGPFWTTNEVDPICRDNWWYNILYINNFASPVKQCMGWTWYIANDMQFFVVSPIILYTLWRWPAIGYSILGLFMSATVAANFGITYHYNFQSGYEKVALTAVNFEALQSGFFEKVYTKPYTRMSPYLVGISLAYYLFKRKHTNSGKLNRITLSCGWIVASAISLASLFCLYHRKLSLLESGFYNALSHASFACGVGWVIFTCLNGQGGPVDRILSCKLFIPLSRLTYCAYLIHPVVLGTYFFALKEPLYFSHFTMVTTYLGMLVVTYVFSFVVSLLFESPIIRLDKLVRTTFMS